MGMASITNPQAIAKPPMTLPQGVVGTRSPYPTVANVTTAHHIPDGMLLKGVASSDVPIMLGLIHVFKSSFHTPDSAKKTMEPKSITPRVKNIKSISSASEAS